jgi:hypothetical protein
MSPSLISSIMGSVLIVAGIAMVIYQMGKVSWARPPVRSAHISPKGVAVRTTYPGIVVIAIGAVMVMVGAVTSN